MRIVLLLFCLITSLIAWTQRYALTSFSTPEGLPQSQVNCINQDDNGYLWIGTLGGLARFNGKDFYTYTRKNGLYNNRITQIKIESDTIWIGHEGGLSKLVNNTIESFKIPSKTNGVQVSAIIRYKKRLFIATNGDGLFLLSKGVLYPVNYSSSGAITFSNTLSVNFDQADFKRIRSLQVVHNKLLVGTRAGIFESNDGRTYKHLQYTSSLSISAIIPSKTGALVSTYLSGCYSLINGKPFKIGILDSLYTWKSIQFDRQGNIWFLAPDIIIRTDSKFNINLKLDSQNSLPKEAIKCIFEDANGTIWLGTDGGGLLKFSGTTFTHYDLNSGLPSPLITACLKSADGLWWFGSFDAGLFYKDQHGFSRIPALSDQTVWGITELHLGRKLVATNSGVYLLSNKTITSHFTSESGLYSDKVTTVCKASNSSFFVGGEAGISIWNGINCKRWVAINSTVRDMVLVGKDLFCATDAGLYKINTLSKSKKMLARFAACSLEKDAYGNLWIGTEEGLFKLSRKGKLKKIELSPFVASDFINFVIQNNHQLYIGTNNGLFSLSQLNRANPTIKNYGLSDGIGNLETNINSAFAEGPNDLWFGIATGLVHMQLGQDQKRTNPPSLVLTDILINYQPNSLRNYCSSITKKGIPQALILPYGKNNLTIQLDAISINKNKGLHYVFNLDDENQNDALYTLNPTYTLNGLNPGDHTLKIFAIDIEGNKSDVLEIPFTIKQAFYKSWWFILFCLLLIGYAIYTFIQTRIKRERAKNELEKLGYTSKLHELEQKSLNASMNRHFIFNALNSIQYYINTQDRLAANKYLSSFAKLIRKNLDSSDDGNTITIEQEIERLQLYLSLEAMRFQNRFDYRFDIDPQIDIDDTLIPAMLLQPFIENSIIHGILPNQDQKGLILIAFKYISNQLQIKIEDNGIGIENSIGRKVQDSGDHKSQGTEITLKRVELIRKISGKTIHIDGPNQRNDVSGNSIGTEVTIFIDQNLLN